MKTSGLLQAIELALAFALMPALLVLSNLATAQVIMPRMRGMSSMQGHHNHPQSRLAAPKYDGEQSNAMAFTFANIDLPSALATFATGINGSGAIVGIYVDTAGNEHGFLLKSASVTISPRPGAPGAPACTGDTLAFSPQCRRGFLYSNGQFSDVLVPGKAGRLTERSKPSGACIDEQRRHSRRRNYCRPLFSRT